MYSTITIPGIEISTGDVLADKPTAPVEAIGNIIDGTRALFFADGHGMRIVHVARMYTVTRKVQDEALIPTVLVIGPVESDDERADLLMVASDVTDQLGFPTVIGASADVDVRNFAAVIVCGPALHDAESVIGTAMILEAEAALYDVPVIHKQKSSDDAPCDGCGAYLTIAAVRDENGELFCPACAGDSLGCARCGEVDERDIEPVYVDGGWVPLCSGGCASIMKALHPSPLNIPEGEGQALMLGVTA